MLQPVALHWVKKQYHDRQQLCAFTCTHTNPTAVHVIDTFYHNVTSEKITEVVHISLPHPVNSLINNHITKACDNNGCMISKRGLEQLSDAVEHTI